MKGKKASELSLQTIVTFIIAVIVLIVIVYFFSTHYTSNSSSLVDLGKGAIDSAKKT